MPISATKRKTREQKIKASARKAKIPSADEVADPSTTPEAVKAEARNLNPEKTYTYVGQDLRKIGLITLVCVALLAVATLLLSDLSVIDQLRNTLHVPFYNF